MAEIYQSSVSEAPFTPTKNGVTVQSTEVPKYSPGAVPPYAASKENKTAQGDPLFEALSRYTPSQPQLNGATPESNSFHPTLPNGDLYYDIKNHVKCYPIFNNNVDALLEQFMSMKRELDLVRTNLAKAEWEAQKERDARLSAESQLRTAEQQLKETQEELKDARAELTEKEAQLLDKEVQLARAVSQISELVTRLANTKKELRDMTRIKEQLENELRTTIRERDFYKLRCADLDKALQIANAGEDAANDRNTRLTKMLFEIEASKALIERAKDAAENKVRFLEQRWRDGPGVIISELEIKVKGLEFEVDRLEVETKGLMVEVAHRDTEIAGLKEKTDALQKDLAAVKQELKDTQGNKDELQKELATVSQRLNQVRTDLKYTQEARDELSNSVNERDAIIQKLPLKCKGRKGSTDNCMCKQKFSKFLPKTMMMAIEHADEDNAGGSDDDTTKKSESTPTKGDDEPSSDPFSGN